MKPTLLVACALVLLPAVSRAGDPFGIEEQFALAPDRAAVLAKLIPGTTDYYYFHCLHAQNTGALGDVAPLLEQWIARHGRGARVVEMENRQALLEYSERPAKSLSTLIERLGLSFDHQRSVPGATTDLPTRLDPGVLDHGSLTARAWQRHRETLDGFTDRALPGLVTSDLSGPRLRALLSRLKRPDHPQLPALVVRELQSRNGARFGSLEIHGELLLSQLEECARLQPGLLAQSEFLAALIERAAPDDDTDWRTDTDAREAYLDRLETLARRLPPVHNAFMAHVLYHRLVHDRALGRHDKQRFSAYLRLPRQTSYVNARHLSSRRRDEPLVTLRETFPTGFGKVGNDEPLVRAYLTHYFRSEESFIPYAPFVQDDWLTRVFAETKILYGLGDMERWYSLLDDPAAYEALSKRVEIEFAETQATSFAPDQLVTLDVDLKHVDTLLVKVFEINTFNWHRERKGRVGTSIPLDGLVANQETTYSYDVPSVRRVRRSFTFPELMGRGVWVIDLIGNGLSSRAVIHKGRLQVVGRVGSAGHVLRVLDETGRHLADSSVWMEGQQYDADGQGEIVVPFGQERSNRGIILRHGDFSTYNLFNHLPERYSLAAGIHVDRESLLAGGTARILVRASLRVNDRVASLALLEDPVLTIQSVDRDGIPSSVELRDLTFDEGSETVHEIQVPERLARLTVGLRGSVRNLSLDDDQQLVAESRSFTVNTIDARDMTACALLGRVPEGYVLDVLGKNGEAVAHQAVQLTLQHRDFTDPIEVSLQTDAEGRMTLGPLEGIVRLSASGLPPGSNSWSLSDARRSLPAQLHGTVGQVLRVPYQGSATTIDRTVVSLLELRGKHPIRDRSAHVALADGFLELRDLPAGDYDLQLVEADVTMQVQVSTGTPDGNWIVGPARQLPRGSSTPLHVTAVDATDDELIVRLAHAGPDARVHVVATRYLTPFHPFEHLRAAPIERPRERSVEQPESSYRAGREIGDEYRYILERRYATKFPGNMLRRSGLLLNPWALDKTSSVLAGGQGGGMGGGKVGRRGKKAGKPSREQLDSIAQHPPGTFPNLDFLPESSRVLANLRPAADGTVRIPRADLGPGQQVHVVALDGEQTIYTTHLLPERPLAPRDRRLRQALDSSRHVAEQRRIELLDAGTTTRVEDIGTARIELIDSLPAVFRLFRTLNPGADLDTFAALLRWPDMPRDEQLAFYSDHACHELHVFLHSKDRAFFDEIVRPYLANKMHRTFLDHWLLGNELSAYLEPWAFARLNVVERILLGRRLTDRAPTVARHLADLLDLLPPDPAGERRLFETALGGTALAAGASLGSQLKAAREELEALGYVDRDEGVNAAAVTPAADLFVPDFAPAEAPASAVAAAPGGRGGSDRASALSGRGRKFSDDMLRRQASQRLYRGPDRTREYAEHNYWHRRIEEQNGNLITVNAFWRDFAETAAGAPFRSGHVAQAAGNVAEMLLALAFLDLPWLAGEHDIVIADGQLSLTAAGPLLLVRKELADASLTEADLPLLISQNMFAVHDRYRFEGNERRDRFVSDEFLVQVVYGCQVVLTNPTSSPRRLELLLQIPRGALPVANAHTTRGVDVALAPFSTSTFEYHFYFPQAGDFPHYPAHVADEGQLVAFAEASVLHVVTEPSAIDRSSWEHVSQNGSLEEVFAFLGDANLYRLDLSRLAWRLGDRQAYEAIVGRLRRRHVYDGTLWSYALQHADVPAIREYLGQSQTFVAACGRALRSPLLDVDPVQRRWYQHIEYEPLIHARAHRFGRDRRILDSSLSRQYGELLDVLAYRPRLNSDDWMAVSYAMALQDRIGEARGAFARVDRDEISMGLQYDYTRAWLDMFSEQPTVAHELALGYADHPVPRWQQRFSALLDQLDEAAGALPAAGADDDRTQQQTALAASEPSLELDVESRTITVNHANLTSCEVSYYAMDIEFLFSTSPFVQQGSGSFAYIRPNRTDSVTLASDAALTSFELPTEFHGSNVLVEARAGGVTRRQAVYANSLSVQLMESYGQLKVTSAETGAPLRSVYVKVFSRDNRNKVQFHKDGYTDLRGRFDYASISGPRNDPERFGILVLSDTDGAVIREANPPPR